MEIDGKVYKNPYGERDILFEFEHMVNIFINNKIKQSLRLGKW